MTQSLDSLRRPSVIDICFSLYSFVSSYYFSWSEEDLDLLLADDSYFLEGSPRFSWDLLSCERTSSCELEEGYLSDSSYFCIRVAFVFMKFVNSVN